MIYRAKCTHVLDVLYRVIDLSSYKLVKECQDTFIEVCNEDLAKQIELLEETTVKVKLQAMRLKDMFG